MKANKITILAHSENKEVRTSLTCFIFTPFRSWLRWVILPLASVWVCRFADPVLLADVGIF